MTPAVELGAAQHGSLGPSSPASGGVLCGMAPYFRRSPDHSRSVIWQTQEFSSDPTWCRGPGRVPPLRASLYSLAPVHLPTKATFSIPEIHPGRRFWRNSQDAPWDHPPDTSSGQMKQVIVIKWRAWSGPQPT